MINSEWLGGEGITEKLIIGWDFKNEEIVTRWRAIKKHSKQTNKQNWEVWKSWEY